MLTRIRAVPSLLRRFRVDPERFARPRVVDDPPRAGGSASVPEPPAVVSNETATCSSQPEFPRSFGSSRVPTRFQVSAGILP